MDRILHILHADDDGEDRWIFQDGLSNCDPAINLTQFEDGLHLLKHIETLQLHPKIIYAIVCDMQMPFIGGLGVLSQVKEMPIWKEMPFFIFTTSSLTEDVQSSMNKGAMGFYSKPNTLTDSQQVIKEMVCRCWQYAASKQLCCH